MRTIKGLGSRGGYSFGTSALWAVGVLSAILFLAGLAWFFSIVKDTLFEPGYFNELIWLQIKNGANADGDIGDKAAAAQFWGTIFGGLIGGGLTMLAAFIALGGALIQLRKESNKEFLEWVVDFNRSFHEDSDYSEVRVAFAERRLTFFKAMMVEEVRDEFGPVKSGFVLGHEYLINWQKIWEKCSSLLNISLPIEGTHEAQFSPAFEKNGGGFQTNWSFVRKITDFMRFYEMVLTVAQRLPQDGNQRETFIGTFAWHIRSVVWGWPENGSFECSRRILAVYYFCQNRFENLAAAGYFFALQHRSGLLALLPKSANDERDSIQKAIDEITLHLTSIRAIYLDKNAKALPSDESILTYWKGVLGNKGTFGF
jgi:hypothetical protein